MALSSASPLLSVPFVVLGAGGFFGQRVTRELVARYGAANVAAAARTEDSALVAAQKTGADHAVALDDAALAFRRLQPRIVLNCTGPYKVDTSAP